MKKNKVIWLRRDWLVGEWKLDWNALDTSGSGNNGTATNVTYTNTDVGYQRQTGVFTRSSWSYIWSPNTLSISPTNWITVSYTISANADAWASRYSYAWCGADSSNRDTMGFLYDHANSAFRCSAYICNTAGTYFNLQSTLPVSSYRNATVTLVYSGWTGGTLSMYCNWKFDNLITITGTPVNINRFGIGVKQQYIAIDSATYFDWKIQSVRLFNRVLSTEEIQNWYKEWKKLLAWKSYNDLMSWIVSYYDMRWDASDIVWVNDGTVTGATLTTDRLWNSDSSYNFIAASSQRITSSVSSFTTWTIWFWFNPTDSVTTSSDTYWFMMTNSSSAIHLYFAYSSTASQAQSFIIRNSSWTSFVASTTTTFVPWTWYYLSCTFNWTNLKAYVNWVLEWTSATFTWTQRIGANLFIGSNHTVSQFINCKVGEFSIYNVVKSDNELKAIYTQSLKEYIYTYYPNLPKQLQNWLQFWYAGNVSWTTAYDISPNANNLTFTSTPTITRRNLIKIDNTWVTWYKTSISTWVVSVTVQLNNINTSFTPIRFFSNSTWTINSSILFSSWVITFNSTSWTSNNYTFPLNDWKYHTVTVTHDWVSTGKIYLDGWLVAIWTVTLSSWNYIRLQNTGKLSNAMIHDRQLSDQEVNMLHKSLYIQ